MVLTCKSHMYKRVCINTYIAHMCYIQMLYHSLRTSNQTSDWHVLKTWGATIIGYHMSIWIVKWVFQCISKSLNVY